MLELGQGNGEKGKGTYLGILLYWENHLLICGSIADKMERRAILRGMSALNPSTPICTAHAHTVLYMRINAQ
jgi:hypothetical protein